MKRNLVLIAVAVVLGFACGIFTPREAEPPGLTENENMLSFGDILRNGTTEEFAKLNYEDILHSSFVYVSAYRIEEVFRKDEEIARLRTIEATYDTTIHVSWEPDTTKPLVAILSKADTVSLYRVYKVHRPTVGDTLWGDSHFRLIYDNLKSNWSILYWKDTPGEHPGFFHPGYLDAQ